MPSHGHRAPSVPTTPSANQWHGGALQWPHQPSNQANALRLSSPAGGHFDELYKGLQPSNPTARTRSRFTRSGLEELASQEARVVQEKGL